MKKRCKVAYHYTCSSKYGDSKLKRFNKPSKNRECTEDEYGRKLAHLSVKSRERFDLFSCWCSRKEVDVNFAPAETHQMVLTKVRNDLKLPKTI